MADDYDLISYSSKQPFCIACAPTNEQVNCQGHVAEASSLQRNMFRFHADVMSAELGLQRLKETQVPKDLKTAR